MDINKLRQAIKTMTRRSKLYIALKDELSTLGYWRNKARGDPFKAKEASDRAKAIANGSI